MVYDEKRRLAAACTHLEHRQPAAAEISSAAAPSGRSAPAPGNTTHDINATEVIWTFFAAHPKP